MVADVIDRFVLHMNGPEHLLPVYAICVDTLGQSSATTSRLSVLQSCRSMDRFTPIAAGYTTRAIRP